MFCVMFMTTFPKVSRRLERPTRHRKDGEVWESTTFFFAFHYPRLRIKVYFVQLLSYYI